MLGYVFGGLQRSVVHLRDAQRSAGYLEFKRARVRWFLSTLREDLPAEIRETGTTYRSISVDGTETEFSSGFNDLHTESYRRVLAGDGYRLDDVRPSIELASCIREADLCPGVGEVHPAAREFIS